MVRWNLFSGLCLASAFLCLPALSSAAPLTLASAIEATLNANPHLAGYQYRYQSLEGERQTAGLGAARELSVELEDFAGSGDSRGLDGAELTLSLSSVLEPRGYRNARLATVDARRDALMTEQQLQTLQLLSELAQQYVRVTAAWDAWQLQGEAQNLAQNTLTSLQQRVAAGAAADADALRAQAALARVEIDVRAAEQRYRSERIALGRFWAETEPHFEQPVGDVYRKPALAALTELLDRVQQNPLLQQAIAEERVLLARLQELDRSAGTAIGWQAGIKHSRASDDTGVVLGVTVPLGARQRLAGEVASASANHRLAQQQRDADRLAALADIRQRYLDWETTWQAVAQFDQRVLPILDQAMTATRRAFESGRYSFQEINSVREELLAARLARLQAAEAAQLAGLQLEWLTGLNSVAGVARPFPDSALPR